MSNDINLLHSKKRGGIADLSTKLKMLRFASVLLLFVVGVFSFILFILVLASPLPSLKEEENNLVASLTTQREKITRYTLLTSRLTDINDILNKRRGMKEIIALFRQELPVEVEIERLSVDEKVVKLSAASTSLESLEKYLSFLRSQVEEKLIIQSLVLNNLSLTGSEYILEVTITLL